MLLNRVSFLEKLIFTKHLATMAKTGISLVEAFETLAQQTGSKKFRNILLSVMKDIENGQPLAKSLGKFPHVFDQFYLSLIEVGEESGTLEKNLEFLAKQMSKDYALRKKIQTAMLHPGLVLSTAVIMGGFISLFILPKLTNFFEAFEVELPLPTRILLLFAQIMKNYGFIIAGCLIGVSFLIYFLIKNSPLKFFWHRFVLKVPLFGELLAFGQLARFSRNLGTLIKSGVPITKSLETTAKTLTNLKFKIDLLLINQTLAKGRNIADAIEKGDFAEFPPLVTKMISVGERTGKLEETLLYLADFYEDEIDNISKNLTTILEPILLIGVGLVVAFVALAIITPIYELTGSIHR